MSFLFAYLASLATPPGWPVGLMYVTETALVILAFVCVLIAVIARGKGTQFWRAAVATVGGVCAGVGLIMPFELAPFFFHARGEVMLATIGLNLVYPIAVIPLILGLRRLINSGTPNVGRDNHAG
jgi:thiosulfate dehydrogenase [quinone] large subunit